MKGLLQEIPASFVENEAVSSVDFTLAHGAELVLLWTVIGRVVPPTVGVDGGDERSPSRIIV